MGEVPLRTGSASDGPSVGLVWTQFGRVRVVEGRLVRPS
jgi:hypothetical protein